MKSYRQIGHGPGDLGFCSGRSDAVKAKGELRGRCAAPYPASPATLYGLSEATYAAIANTSSPLRFATTPFIRADDVPSRSPVWK